MSPVGWKDLHLLYQHTILVVIAAQILAVDKSCNEPSSLLSEEENKLLFKIMGKTRRSRAATVVQMFHAHERDGYQWTKYKTGVVVLVEHSSAFYIKLFDLPVSLLISISYDVELEFKLVGYIFLSYLSCIYVTVSYQICSLGLTITVKPVLYSVS